MLSKYLSAIYSKFYSLRTDSLRYRQFLAVMSTLELSPAEGMFINTYRLIISLTHTCLVHYRHTQIAGSPLYINDQALTVRRNGKVTG